MTFKCETYEELQKQIEPCKETHNFSSITVTSGNQYYIMTASPRQDANVKDFYDKLKESFSNMSKGFANIDIESLIKTAKNGR